MKRKIIPAGQLNADVSLAGSKYTANRLVIMAALTKEPVELNNVVSNDDINTAIEGLNALGYSLKREGDRVVSKEVLSNSSDPVNVYTAHSGTFSRFVTAVAALQSKDITITGSNKMNSRPMIELFSALRQLGVSVSSESDTLPAVIKGPIQQAQCDIDASRSSQYVSALLLAAPASEHSLDIRLVGKQVSQQYIEMTTALMKEWGVEVEHLSDNHYRVPAGQMYKGGSYTIAPDPVSSSYFMGAAAINGGSVTLQHFDFDSLQGEAGFYKVLEQMGCDIIRRGNSLEVRREKSLKGLEIDMGEMPDVVQTLAAVACFSEGTTVMKNIAHLAYKESNRIADTATELKKTGIHVDFGADYLAVTGGQARGALLETYDDHRMAMSLGLLGGRVEGIMINEAEVVAKSFPDYWDKLNFIGIKSEVC
ncbi:3-phosphoshikimate 1-carboxyvinyltransferase [Pleionea sp. CnH1-48]|uniref:3-phosphoshikimate 1-carboxyvinyltransferase n=1 Tax=Pleionea sp. CnH1-48 TaxID=2954494 RepID=UPI002097E2DB|nr:3-phosphoshikimate 1-carboxyvinyltransferase [Pleionea sp. CnH1-48]MCO7223088.1 3-phosphoshikimate 1-carboxyvinyltransferase [Pleionea sp. CnH1-48]